jgi:hypothetical protein
VAVSVMKVRIVRMPVNERLMPMAVGMWLARRRVGAMLVLMMRVVAMPVLVFVFLMDVLVLVALGEVQP